MKKYIAILLILFCTASYGASVTRIRRIAGKKAYYLDDGRTISVGNISKVDEFQSHLKMTFWGEDSIALEEEGVKGTPTVKDNILELDLSDVKYQWYKDTKTLAGRNHYSLKWVRILKRKPASNKFIHRFTGDGWRKFKFCYQTPFSEEALRYPGTKIEYFERNGEDWIRQVHPPGGAILYDERPLCIDGSYAVVHKTKVNHRLGGKNYGTGQVLEILRGKAVDAMGKWVWKELSIENDALVETIPQKFLDEAVYPVRSNATFGYESVGASTMGCDADYQQSFWLGTIGEDGTCTIMHLYCSSSETNMPICMALYDNDPTGYSGGGDDDKDPDNRLALSNALSLTKSAEWMDFPVTGGGSFSAGGLWTAENNDATFVTRYTTDAGYDQSTTWYPHAWTGTPSNDLEDPWGSANGQRDDRKTSSYITYTPAAAAVGQVIFVEIN